MSTKPIPHANVYDWIPGTSAHPDVTAHDMHTWLRAVAPSVAADVTRLVVGQDRGTVRFIYLDDIEREVRTGDRDGITLESIAWLRENVAPAFGLRVWW